MWIARTTPTSKPPRHRVGARTVATLAAALAILVALAFGSPPASAQDDPPSAETAELAAAQTRVEAELEPANAARLAALLDVVEPFRRASFLAFTDILIEGDRGNFARLMLEEDPAGQARLFDFLVALPPSDLGAFAATLSDRAVEQWSLVPPLLARNDAASAMLAMAQPYNTYDCDPATWTLDLPYNFYVPQLDEDGNTLDGLPLPPCVVGLLAFTEEWGWPTAAMIGGVEIFLEEAPWQVQVLRAGRSAASYYTPLQAAKDRRAYGRALEGWERNHICGAVYLGESWVLTAAHCIGNWNGRNADFFDGRRVRMGTIDIDGGGEVMAIDAVVRHGSYVSTRKGSDIALLHLEQAPSAADLRTMRVEKIAPATSSGRAMRPGQKLEVTGWGMTGETKDTSSPVDRYGGPQRISKYLLLGRITYQPVSACDTNPNFIESDIKLRTGQLCAGSPNNIDSCKGDSGGPLVRKEANRPVLVGLVSFGPGCGLDNTPGVYTDVGYFESNEWIERAKAQMRRGMIVDYADGRCRHDGQRISCQRPPAAR